MGTKATDMAHGRQVTAPSDNACMNTHEPTPLPNDLISTSEAIRLIPGTRPGKAIHVATLYRLVLAGKLRGWKVGRRTLVSRSEVVGLIRPLTVKGEAERRLTRQQEDAQTTAVLRKFGLEG